MKIARGRPFASDANLINADRHAMHGAPGFVATGRVVRFPLPLR